MRSNRIASRLAVLIALIGLTACSGGGDSDGAGADALNPIAGGSSRAATRRAWSS